MPLFSPKQTSQRHQLAFALGLLSSFFFSFTFLLNRSMAKAGGHPLWTSSLRFLFLFPLLWLLVTFSGERKAAHRELKKNPKRWFFWSWVGFWVFYFFLCIGANYGNSWLVAGTWQSTLVAGVLLTPLFGSPLPRKNLFWSAFIFLGVLLLQGQEAFASGSQNTILCVLPILIAAIAYPLGNRKLMAHNHNLTTVGRVYLMTLCTLPVWLLQATYAWRTIGLPSLELAFQALLVAFFSGFLATLLFFYATDLSKGNLKSLAITESTIAAEVIFTLIGGLIFLKDPPPQPLGWVGFVLILIGMILNR